MMAIQYTVSRNVQELLADAKWKAWKKRTEGKHHSSAAECIEPDPYGYCESPSLRLTTYVRIGKEKREWTDEKGKVKTETDNSRSVEIPSIVQCCNKKPQESDLIALFRRIPGSVSFVAELKSRLIVNQAGGVIENGALCLHPHFGYPYIPGSAVKGCARHAAWQAWNEAEEDDAKVAAAKEVAEIFGYPTKETGLDEYLKVKCGYEKAQSGKVAFLAAVPETKAKLVTDVLTPHGGNDWTDPIPNVFPAVEEGVKFNFIVAPLCKGMEIVERARHFLILGLIKNGIGAKTNVGYGYFVSADMSANPPDLRVNLHFDSPAFLRGVQDEGALRISTLRGMLRWWWRWIYRSILKESDLQDLEKRVWGGCSGQSPVASCVSLRFGNIPANANLYPFNKKTKAIPFENLPHGRMSGLAYLSYGMDENTQRRKVLDPHPNDVWELLVDVVPREEVLDSKKLIKHVKLAIWALTSFGGVGSRSRKGFGSLSSDVVYTDENAVYVDMFEAIQGLGYQQMLDDDYIADYSMFGSIRGTITLNETNVWKVLDRIGYALQNVATDYKHQEEKAVLGLPRQIHGPLKNPMKHQLGHKHQPPKNLRAKSPAVEGRFVSPLAVHIAKLRDGIRVSLTAFPSDLVRDYDTSECLLKEEIGEIIRVFDESCRVTATDGACAPNPE